MSKFATCVLTIVALAKAAPEEGPPFPTPREFHGGKDEGRGMRCEVMMGPPPTTTQCMSVREGPELGSCWKSVLWGRPWVFGAGFRVGWPAGTYVKGPEPRGGS